MATWRPQAWAEAQLRHAFHLGITRKSWPGLKMEATLEDGRIIHGPDFRDERNELALYPMVLRMQPGRDVELRYTADGYWRMTAVRRGRWVAGSRKASLTECCLDAIERKDG